MEHATESNHSSAREMAAHANPTAREEWPAAPLALHASELIGLSEKEVAETLWSLMLLSQRMAQDDIILLDLGNRDCDEVGCAVHARIDELRGEIMRLCSDRGLFPPHIAIEKNGAYVDLRMTLGLPRTKAA